MLNEVDTMDIGAGNTYPADRLSNFTPHHFVFNDVVCHSMEGLLQAFKFKNPDMQAEVCTMIGVNAKYKGKKKKWGVTQTLWWKGKEIDRHGDEYQNLLDRAYQAMYNQCPKFRKALKASGNAVFTHSKGRWHPSVTILTVSEFCGRLTKLRDTGKLV